MKTLQEWLDRKPAGPKPRKRIARNVRPKRVSDRRRRENPEYKATVAAHLAEFPRCQVGPRIKAGGFEVRCLGVATHVHHVRGRGRFLCDRTTFLSSCGGDCHPPWIHQTNVADAYALGLLK
jgi:hypothetical protein